eukprot:gnl/Chilomastix_caulleri/594.p1 GENE.gnl/Chilomastix_caulleri/594~~gnl/Chilomastix_caulleri/594.p1  ORF type:complete len:147 (+),score=52.72 gnl/Chilomastix_caulleri/594:236-676(+)
MAKQIVITEGVEQEQGEEAIPWGIKVEGDLTGSITVGKYSFGPFTFTHNQLGVLEGSAKSGNVSLRISPRANGSFDATIIEGRNIKTIRVNQPVTKKQSSPIMKILPMASLLLIPFMRKFQAKVQRGQAPAQAQAPAPAPAPAPGQ